MKRDRDYYLNKAIALTVAEPGKKIMTPADSYEILKPYGLKEQEHFIVINLNAAHEVISTICVSMGIINRTIVHPREVFRRAISDNAMCIVIAHNHPSGQMEPSEEDRNITKRLKEAGEILGIQVLDHLIVAKDKYFSFVESGIGI